MATSQSRKTKEHYRNEKASEYNQETTQSHTADQPMAP